MNTDTPQSAKKKLRKTYSSLLDGLSEERREEASQALLLSLLPTLTGTILSFASKGSEINLTPFNLQLAGEGRLVLPRLLPTGLLELYRVKNFPEDLVRSKWYIDEPDPLVCEKVTLNDVDHCVVPALAYDSGNNRLGYGKGCFDRLLAGVSTPIIGVGFKEQLAKSPLPVEEHDISVSKLFLV